MSLIVLNFHGVGPVTRDIGIGERNCWLDQAHFEAVLDLVRDQPNVRLTVDDGNISDLEYILPALLTRGLKATFFICSGRLDQPTFLSRTQVRELQDKGMLIGSHGVDHVPWRSLSPTQLMQELASSRRVLEEVCGRSVDTAACPFGSYSRKVLKGLKQADYRTVYTSDGGSASENQWIQARTTIIRTTPLSVIRDLVQNGSTGIKQSVIDVRKLVKQLR